jgi:hypothetical protein
MDLVGPAAETRPPDGGQKRITPETEPGAR